MCTCSHSGAGGRSGLIPRRAKPEETAFRALDFGNGCISLLLLADNYNHTTNDFTTKARRHKGRAKRFETVLQHRDPCGAVGSSARLPFACGCPASRAALVAAAIGPGRPGLLRCCQGGLACLTSDRAGRREARSAHDHGFTRRRYRREVPMRKGQFFTRALGPRRWSRFSAKAVLGQ
jgi:hypothetical protein